MGVIMWTPVNYLRGGKREVFPSEMVILMAIAVTRDAGEKLLNRPMDVVGKYLGYLYDSLVTRGYLRRDDSRGYKLTPKGRESLFEFLYANKTRVKDAVKALQRLGIEINLEEDSLEREAIKVGRKAKRLLSPSFTK